MAQTSACALDHRSLPSLWPRPVESAVPILGASRVTHLSSTWYMSECLSKTLRALRLERLQVEPRFVQKLWCSRGLSSLYIISLFCLKCPKPRELQYWSRPLFWANLSSCSQMVVPTCSPSCEYVLLPTGTGSGGLVDLDFRSLWKTGLQ